VKRVLLAAGLIALAPLVVLAGGTSTAMAQVTNPSSFSCSSYTPVTSSETSDGIPVFFTDSSSVGCLDGIHTCRVVGNDGTTQAVECADIFAEGPGENGNTNLDVWPVEEGYCQNLATDDIVQCANVEMTFQLNNPGGATASYTYTCGHSAGACDASGRNEDYGNGGSYDGPPDIAPGGQNEIWTEITSCTIQLPGSDMKVSCDGNMGTSHAIVNGPV
jgi:hypothetical protein